MASGTADDKLVSEQEQAPTKVEVAGQQKKKEGRSSRHQCGGNLQKSGAQLIPRRAVFGQGLGLNDPYVQSWGVPKGRLCQNTRSTRSTGSAQWTIPPRKSHATCMHDHEIRPTDLAVMGAIASSDLAQILWR